MKRSLKGIGIIAATMAAALTTAPQATTMAHTTHQVQEQKAARIEKSHQKSVHVENHRSGLDVVSFYPDYGLSPKEYGQRFGCKKHGKKTNFKRLSHNAKVRRR
jgi:hypothetical protein